MERITIRNRTTKTEGEIKIRFRLRDSGGVELHHKSGIKANLKELAQFNIDGTIKGRKQIVNRKLKAAIDDAMKLMSQAYANLCTQMDKTHISGELFEKEIARLANPETPTFEASKESMIARYDRFIKESYRDKNFNEKRMKSYVDLLGCITRFLKIKHLEKISADEFTAELLRELSEFFADEYLYVDKHKRLYSDLKGRAIPKAKRVHNTVVTRLNKVQAFFNHLLELEEIEVSPFYKLGKKRRAQMMKEEYDDDPVNLQLDELMAVINADVPESLSETRDAFVLQCSLGLRINEFQKMTMEKVDVTDDGIPFVHYLPSKTLRGNKKKVEIQTPIMHYALNIIKKYQFNFRILKYVSGKSGYNVKLRQLLKYCRIDRKVKVYNDEKADNDFFPIYERASNKAARATHVHLMDSVQINHYISGLHKPGSDAVFHYNRTGLADLFALMCAAYNQPLYKVDKELNVIGIPN